MKFTLLLSLSTIFYNVDQKSEPKSFLCCHEDHNQRERSFNKMSDKSLVIVESPTKAKTIKKFLPSKFEVLACNGHIRDLPYSATSIPAKYKKLEWAKVGVNVKEDFAPLYVLSKGRSKLIQEIKKKLKESSTLYLATDEDREGESISWHLMEVLKPKIPTKRMVFHEITKKSIEQSLKNCRTIDMNLVQAQEARRILDRLYGYTLSPLIWKKIAFGLSAGRVQSTGLRLIVNKEKERMAFVQAEYWDIRAQVTTSTDTKKPFELQLSQVGNQKIAQGSDFEDTTGLLKATKKDKVLILNEKKAQDLKKELSLCPWLVEQIKERQHTSAPPIPYITSTLQQDANRKLGLAARQTMQIAQKLYEEGLITYMRTDSPALSDEAIQGTRQAVSEHYGKDYLEPKARQFRSKSKSAQEAHEAIRPAGASFTPPTLTSLRDKELSLYQMIWQRTLATQMKAAQKSTKTIQVKAGECLFSTSGTTITFAGYLKAYQDAGSRKEALLPPVKEKENLKPQEITAAKHETKPPGRYNEAALVQKMEKEGIGRPSTYASIISTIIERNYVTKKGHALVPTFVGIAVMQLLEKHFSKLVDYKFTSEMENQLDEIACGDLIRAEFLKSFYLGKNGLEKIVEKQEEKIKPEESRTIELNHLVSSIKVKIGRYGAYAILDKGKKNEDPIRASIPEDIAPSELNLEKLEDIIEHQSKGPTPLGKFSETGENIYCLIGRYGAYLQLGEATEENPKPKRQSLPKGYTVQNITIEAAIKALSLPLKLGTHPKLNVPIFINIGRFGPYLECNDELRSIKTDDVFSVTLEEALEILAQEKKSTKKNKLIKEIKDCPQKNKKTSIFIGRFGPYMKVGTKNVSIPKGELPTEDIEATLQNWDKDKVKEIIKQQKK